MKNRVVWMIACILLMNIFCSFSQSRMITRYFSKKNKEVPKDQSYYYEIRSETLKDKDTLVTYYSENDQIRSISIVSESGAKNGPFRNYHENGKLKSKGTFKSGSPDGTIISYYPSGKAQAIESFNAEDNTSFIVNYYDSIGNQIITNGNGRCTCFFDSYRWSQKYEKGIYRNSKKDSLWTGHDLSGKTIFKEFYMSDSLISGESYDSLGAVYSYHVVEKMAEPKKGLQDVYERIGKSLRYPAEARRFNVQGKVIVQFVVEKDGSIDDVKCIKGIGGGCDEEAVRVVKSLPAWKPGLVRGQAVRTKYVLPLNFKMR
jgi:TonB family protein